MESGAVSAPAGVPPPEPTLADVMLRVGTRLPFGAAVGVCALSVAALALNLAFGLVHWRLSVLLAISASFGAWTVAAHERGPVTIGRHGIWPIVQGISAAVGVAAVFVLFLSVLASALGLWIS